MPNKPKTIRTLGMIPPAPRKDLRTLTAAQRGYDSRWQGARAIFLKHNPLCLYCRRQLHATIANVIDHNPPHLGDMRKFWDRSTWVPCCTQCHNHVTATFDGGGGNPIKPRDGAYVSARAGETQ